MTQEDERKNKMQRYMVPKMLQMSGKEFLHELKSEKLSTPLLLPLELRGDIRVTDHHQV